LEKVSTEIVSLLFISALDNQLTFFRSLLDWAHLEHFCRELTKTFSDVYVLTGPLYLPHQEADGKFYVKYQMIGNPPNVAVPTHFYKVIMTHHNGKYNIGAFVLPNQPIPDQTPLTAFKVPLDAVERGTGLVFFDRMGDAKNALEDLCRDTECKLVIRKFNDAKNKALPPQ
jgi:endonuclease G